MALIVKSTIAEAWLAGLEYLQGQPNREDLNLITTVEQTFADNGALPIVSIADAWLRAEGLQQIGTVANTIFPIAYARNAGAREAFYHRYRTNLRRIKRHKKNTQGTYFERLIDYRTGSEPIGSEGFNQIEHLIRKLEGQLQARGPKRFVYQAQVFQPQKDAGKLMGFPCLSFVSFQLSGNPGSRCLNLTATYRNQFYFERALGNFIGLARLLEYVSQESGLAAGAITVHACHAEIDILSAKRTRQFIADCRQAL